jgi:hypothetical protein
MGVLLLIGGAIGLLVTRLGWVDPGGPLRRMDWWGVYKILDHKYIGRGARRANYLICGTMVAVGLVVIVLGALRDRAQ